MSTYILRKGISTLNDLADGYSAVFAGATNVFYVDAQHAQTSDSNEGTDPNKPMKTITAAYGRCTDGLSDLIVVKGGVYRYRESATLTIEKDGITILGSGWGCEWNNNGLAGGYVVKIQSKHVRIMNIQISVNDSGSGIYVGDGAVDANASLCTIENCFIRGDWYTAGGPGAGVLYGIVVDGAALCTIRNNHIWEWATGIDITDGADRTSYGAHVYDNFIVGCKTYGINLGGYGYTSIIHGNRFMDHKASVNMTAAINLAPSVGGVMVSGNFAGCNAFAADNGDLNFWVGNFVRQTEATSETFAVGMDTIDGVENA